MATAAELREAAEQVAKTESWPPLEQCYGLKELRVPVQAWLAAKAVACAWLAENDQTKVGAAWLLDYFPQAKHEKNGEFECVRLPRIGLVCYPGGSDGPTCWELFGSEIWEGRTVTRGMVTALTAALSG